MEWHFLVLVLSLTSSVRADCTALCTKCAQRVPEVPEPVSGLTCALECEGVFSSTTEFDKCAKALRFYPDGNTMFDEEQNVPDSLPKDQDSPVRDIVKRYGGFIKRIDKNKLFNFPSRENDQLKGAVALKYADLFRKFGERAIPEPSQDAQQVDSSLENETDIFNEEKPVNEVKRYGGFLRKLVPKRSDSEEKGDQEELQKRYGGFMRRIRPKLRWDNQKRYGGFLRRHFKISV